MSFHLGKSFFSILKIPKWNSAQYANAFLQMSFKNYSNKVEENIDTATVTPTQRKNRGRDKDNPILVASTTDKCIVGCGCSNDDPTLQWFFLEEGPAQTCDCGYYFKLDKQAENQWIPEYSRIMQVDKTKKDPRELRKGMPFGRQVRTQTISPFEKPKIKTSK